MTGGREEPCTKCGAKAGEPCRTLTTGRVTDIHKARWLPIVTRRIEQGEQAMTDGVPMVTLESAIAEADDDQP